MKTIWNEKRCKSGLNRSDVAKMLGVSYERYILIEKGLVKMPSNLIDKFNAIINKGKNENKLNKLENDKKVNDYIDWLLSNDSNGNSNLSNKMSEFNISTQKELGVLLGYADGTCISQLKQNKDNVAYDFKNRIYDFFNDELNIQPKKEVQVIKTKKPKNIDDEITPEYVLNYCKENNMALSRLERLAGLGRTTLQVGIKNNSRFSPKTIRKLNAYFRKLDDNKEEELDDNKEEELVFPELPNINVIDNNKDKDVSKEILINTLDNVKTKWQKRYEENISKQFALGVEMGNLQEQLELKQKEYDRLKEEEKVYSEILEDLEGEE